jgi:hypothetical protein
MSERITQTMTEAQGREAQTVLADAAAPHNHLHFDRRLRVWRGHLDRAGESTLGVEGYGTPELRSA